ncbi:MAG: ATP-binding cassette domain-containing protein, partial [Candidatus Dormibacteria bacterium]
DGRFSRRSGGLDGDAWSPGEAVAPIPKVLAALPEVRAVRGVGLLAVAGAAAFFALLAPPSLLDAGSIAAVYAVVAISIVVLSGWSGSISLGQFAIAGFGALVVANLVGRFNVDLFVALVAAALTGGVIALLVGLPALRVRGLFLAVTTLGLAVVTDTFVINPVNFPWLGIQAFDRPVLWKRFDLISERPMFLLALGVLAAVCVLTRGLAVARPGRALRSARDNAVAAAATGLAVTRLRLSGFVTAGIFAGLAGGLHATILRSVGFHTYDSSRSLLVFSMAVVGGITSIGGALLGVAAVMVLVHFVPGYEPLVAGTGVLVVLVVFPGGIMGLVIRLRDLGLAQVAKRRGLVVRTPELRPVPAAGGGGESPTARQTGDSQLSCAGVTAAYGDVGVLFGVDFAVEEGELVALLGTNGAGKSTLLRTVTGLLPPGGGEIRFDGQNLRGLSPEAIARRGVSLVPGGRGVFPSLTVRDNLRLGSWLERSDPATRRGREGDVLSLFPLLQARLSMPAGVLSGGEQQMLSLAMALVCRPRLLLIDELSLGLSPKVLGDLVERVKEIHASGCSIVVVEQSVDVALMLARRAVFMEKGAVRFEGLTSDLRARDDILRAVFVGGAVPSARVSNVPGTVTGPSRNGDESIKAASSLLECAAVSKSFGGVAALDEVDLSVAEGRIVGLVGHNGAGKTTLLNLVSGLIAADSGTVTFGSREIGHLAPHRRAHLGIGRGFQDARLFPSLTVAEALAIALDRHLHSREPVAAALRLPASLDTEAAVALRVEELLEMFRLEDLRDRQCGALSTGLRRLVEMASCLAQSPRLLLLDEPTAGVAQREAEALVPVLLDVQRRTGAAMLIVEHDIALLTSISDELVALAAGRVIAKGKPSDVLADPAVIESYLGSASVTSRARRRGGRSAGVTRERGLAGSRR